MTKEEINDKKNSYKYKLNDCNATIDKYNTSIKSFNQIKTYFNAKTPEKQKLSHLFLTIGLTSLPLAIVFLFSAPIVGTILLINSIIAFERFCFFKTVTKKFKKCSNFFSKVINSLRTKQLNYLNQKELALHEICRLENEIPDEIIETMAMIQDDNISEFVESAIIQKCIERTSKTNDETIGL